MIKKQETLLLCIIIIGLLSLIVPVVSAATENIDFGVTKTSSIDVAGEVDTYTFTGNTGDGIDIRITKTSGTLWPRLTLFGSNGKEIKRSYDSTSTEISYVLTTPGTYKILVDNGLGGTYTGDYSLFVQNINNPKNTKVVEFDTSATGSIDTPGSINTYSFTGNKGDEIVIRITKTSGTLWPRLTLYGSNGKEIKRSFDSTSTELTYTLVLPGTHIILVDNGLGGTYTGDYNLFTQITSGNQSNTDLNENPISTGITTVASPIMTPSRGTTESVPREESQTNYLLAIIIAIVIIGAIVVAYSKLIKKPKGVRDEGVRCQAIQVPPSWEKKSGTQNHDIIISYSSFDKPIADAVCAGLEGRKIRCWIAPRDILPGVNYQEGIIDAISSSKIMVLIYSSNANESPHVIREATIAMAKKVIIIPFRIDDSPLSKTMEFIISVPHWLEAMTPPLEKHIGELGDTIEILLENERKKRNTGKNGDSN